MSFVVVGLALAVVAMLAIRGLGRMSGADTEDAKGEGELMETSSPSVTVFLDPTLDPTDAMRFEDNTDGTRWPEDGRWSVVERVPARSEVQGFRVRRWSDAFGGSCITFGFVDGATRVNVRVDEESDSGVEAGHGERGSVSISSRALHEPQRIIAYDIVCLQRGAPLHLQGKFLTPP